MRALIPVSAGMGGALQRSKYDDISCCGNMSARVHVSHEDYMTVVAK